MCDQDNCIDEKGDRLEALSKPVFVPMLLKFRKEHDQMFSGENDTCFNQPCTRQTFDNPDHH